MIILLVMCLALPLGIAQAAAPPYMPQVFYGEVTIGGVSAGDGITISAEIDDVEYASTTTSGGEYLLEVPGEDPAEPGKQGGQPGDTIVFKVSGEVADSQAFEQGMFTPLNLAIAGTPLPVAEFSASPLSGNEPLTVEFTDESLNMADSPSWSWDFGDGGTSTEASPTHQYLEVGSYTVTLTVTTAYGSDTEIKADYIVVTAEGAFDPNDYETNGTEGIQKDEALAAVADYLAGDITKSQALAVVKLYFS